MNLELLAVLGVVATVIITLIRRFVAMNREEASLIAMLVSVVLVALLELYKNNWNIEALFSNFVTIYGVSQVVYEIVLKRLKLDEVLENK